MAFSLNGWLVVRLCYN